MNDFTKEELFDLESCVIFWGCNGNTDKAYLKEKLRKMIENYCEHKWRCWDDEHNSRECIKCGEKRTGEINE